MWLCCSCSTLSFFAFCSNFFFYQLAISGQAGYCWLHGHGQWSSPAPFVKRWTLRVWTPEVPLPKYSFAFWTTFVSQTDFCLLWFCSLVQLPKSLFVPLYSELHQCNKQKNMHRIHIKISFYFPPLTGFSASRRKARLLGLICPFLWLIISLCIPRMS